MLFPERFSEVLFANLRTISSYEFDFFEYGSVVDGPNPRRHESNNSIH